LGIGIPSGISKFGDDVVQTLEIFLSLGILIAEGSDEIFDHPLGRFRGVDGHTPIIVGKSNGRRENEQEQKSKTQHGSF